MAKLTIAEAHQAERDKRNTAAIAAAQDGIDALCRLGRKAKAQRLANNMRRLLGLEADPFTYAERAMASAAKPTPAKKTRSKAGK